MDKRFFICAILILVLAALAFWAYTSLEIYDRKARVPPVREAAVNMYLAMDRWLAQTGHPLRVEKRGSPAVIAAGKEKIAVVQAAFCNWKNAAEILGPWIEAGGSLLVSLEYSFYDESLAKWLVSLGISANNFPRKDETSAAEAEVPEKTAADEDEAPAEIADNEAETVLELDDDEESENDLAAFPNFDYNMSFFVDSGKDIFTIRSRYGAIKLARISLGKGSLTITGPPVFMYNQYLGRDINARLAWELTAAKTSDENPGIFVIRDKRVTKGLFGKLVDRGNIAPPLISAVLLILLGFWMVIPVFGLVMREKQTVSRPIRERFLAEAGFLKKYRSLDYYLGVYQRELKLEKTNVPLAYRDIIRLLRKMQANRSV